MFLDNFTGGPSRDDDETDDSEQEEVVAIEMDTDTEDVIYNIIIFPAVAC
jgi:hypothetical protein